MRSCPSSKQPWLVQAFGPRRHCLHCLSVLIIVQQLKSPPFVKSPTKLLAWMLQVFDECHHTQHNHPFNTVAGKYRDLPAPQRHSLQVCCHVTAELTCWTCAVVYLQLCHHAVAIRSVRMPQYGMGRLAVYTMKLLLQPASSQKYLCKSGVLPLLLTYLHCCLCMFDNGTNASSEHRVRYSQLQSWCFVHICSCASPKHLIVLQLCCLSRVSLQVLGLTATPGSDISMVCHCLPSWTMQTCALS